MKFKKKPAVIDAIKWTPGVTILKEFGLWPENCTIGVDKNLYIKNLGVTMCAEPGDWIIRDVKGEYYPCKHSIFELTYERVEDEV